METKVGVDINYSKALLNNVFKCSHCKSPLAMDGCINEICENYYKTRIKEQSNKSFHVDACSAALHTHQGGDMNDIAKHKCWECGRKAKWEKHLYHISKGFHSKVYFCDNMKCHETFNKNNAGKFTQTASYHNVA